MDVSVADLLVIRDGRPVLQIPELTFPSGTTTAVFGPNGSGKTTLLRLIAGLERPSRGAVRLGDARVEQDPAARKRVGMAFQTAVFLRGSVRQNLDLALRLRDVPAPDRKARIEEAAHECGIAAVLDRPARHLSGGEAQRVNLARALALRASITLLDEPLAGIHRSTRTQLLADLPRLLATFAATTILVTHDREEAFRLADFRLADRLVVVIAGSVRAAGVKGSVYAHPPDRETAELLGYTVLTATGRTVAIPPGGLQLGDGALGFNLAVGQVIDMGHHLHVAGTIEGCRADVRLPAGVAPPPTESALRVHATSHVPLPSRPGATLDQLNGSSQPIDPGRRRWRS
jgi:ABC-type sugar transport system ATPase subunit